MTRELEPGEELLTDPDEIWYRHAFPGAVEDRGVIGPVAFRLTDVDAGKLSGARSSKVSAAASYAERAQTKPNTAGTWGISVSEIGTCGLRCIDDSGIPAEPPRPTGHTYVDLRGVPDTRAKEVRQELADFANDRGRLHP